MKRAEQAGELHIRAMTAEDLVDVHRMERIVNVWPWAHGVFCDCMRPNYRCWLLESDNLLAGYSIINIQAGEAHLLNLVIGTEFQGRGLGRKLLTFSVQDSQAQGATMIFLEVRVSNHRAIGLYESSGFAEVGLRRGYYPANQRREDAVVMARELGGGAWHSTPE